MPRLRAGVRRSGVGLQMVQEDADGAVSPHRAEGTFNRLRRVGVGRGRACWLKAGNRHLESERRRAAEATASPQAAEATLRGAQEQAIAFGWSREADGALSSDRVEAIFNQRPSRSAGSAR